MPNDAITLTAKPNAFAGAVLSPNHARTLTPSLCVAISSALAEQCHRRSGVPYTRKSSLCVLNVFVPLPNFISAI